MSDFFQSGGGVELHAGVRIAQYFTPVLFGAGEAFGPGNGTLGLGKPSNPGAQNIGIGLIVGTQPHKLGGYGEIDFVGEAYSFSLRPGNSVQECKVKVSGGAVRIGGGGFLPVLPFLNATAFAMITIGRFGSVDASGPSCPGPLMVLSNRDIDSGDQRTHSSVFIGLGGDFVFGADRVKE
jgi:hypothetical protein